MPRKKDNPDNTDIDQFLGSLVETHQRDQVYQNIGEWARVLWHFYSRLTAQGFTEEQAMTILRDWFQTLMSSGGKTS